MSPGLPWKNNPCRSLKFSLQPLHLRYIVHRMALKMAPNSERRNQPSTFPRIANTENAPGFAFANLNRPRGHHLQKATKHVEFLDFETWIYWTVCFFSLLDSSMGKKMEKIFDPPNTLKSLSSHLGLGFSYFIRATVNHSKSSNSRQRIHDKMGGHLGFYLQICDR